MASKVKGISIEVGLDTTRLKQGLSETDKQLKKEQTQLKKINQSMRYDLNPLDAWNRKNAQLQKMLVTVNKALDDQVDIAQDLKDKYEDGLIPKDSLDNAVDKLFELRDQYEDLGMQAEYAAAQIKKITQEQKLAKWDNLIKVGQSLSAISASVGSLASAIGASEVKTADYINQMGDLASASGLAFEQYQKLAYAMSQVGASADTMKSSMAKVNSILGNLATGNGLASAQTLAKLGINYKEFAKLDTESAFYALVDALKNVENETERVGLANSLFGTELGTKLLPVINAGSSALKEYGKQTSVISDEQATASKTFENMTTNLKAEFAAIGAELLPTMNELLGNLLSLVKDKIAPALKGLADKINALSPSMKNILAIGSAAATALGPLLIVVGKIGKSLGSLGTAMEALGAAGGGKIGIIIAAVAALVAILAKAYQTDEGFRDSVNSLASTLKDSLGEVLKTIGDILTDLKPVIDLIVKNVAGLIKTIIPPLNVLIKAIASGLKHLLTFLQPFIDLIGTNLVIQLGWLKDAFDFIASGTETISNWLQSALDWIEPLYDWFDDLFKKISAVIQAIGGKGSIKEALGNLGDFLYNTFKPVIDWFTKIWGTITNAVKTAANAISDFFKKMWEGIKDFFSGFGQKFVDFWQSLGNWFTGNGWNTNAELQEQATASSKRMANRQNNTTNNTNTTNNNNNDNRTYNVTINTSADSMSFDELDRQLGASLA